MSALISLSGGMDSATLLGHVVEKFGPADVQCVGFTYGSKHNRYEQDCARRLANHYGVPYDLVVLDSIMSGVKSDLMKSGGDIPEGHYEAESMSATVVPGRNVIFASLLMSYAWSRGLDTVYLGIHAGDHAIYPDCRPEWFTAMQAAVRLGSDGKVDLAAPFLHGTKVSIIAEGTKLHVPYHMTRTCYKDQEISCGKCGSCQERLEGFALNEIEDPIQYESRTILPKG